MNALMNQNNRVKSQLFKSLIILSFIYTSCQRQTTEKKEINLTKSEVSIIHNNAKIQIKNLNLKKAEELLKEAIDIEESSDLYIDLFRVLIAQDKNDEAENAIKHALDISDKNPDGYFIYAKYIFTKGQGKEMDSVKIYLEKAYQLGDKEAKAYMDILSLCEEYKRSFVNMDYEELINVNFPDATNNFYGNKHNAKKQLKNLFIQLKEKNANIVDWTYMLPFEIYSEDQKMITKIRTATTFKVGEEYMNKSDHMLLISLDNGDSWYTLTYDDSYKSFLSKYFRSGLLDNLYTNF